jgi:hypothetical protein
MIRVLIDVPNPLIKSGDKPWERLVAYCSVYQDPETSRYQMWYQAYLGAHAKDKALRCVVCYAESRDGIHWNKPDLELFPFGDIKKTNIVLLSNEGPSTHYGASVVVNPNEPDPTRRYKMAYWDFVARGEQYTKGLCVAFSPDGIHWTEYSGNPVSKTADTPRELPPLRQPNSAVPSEEGPLRFLAVSEVIDATFDTRLQKYVIYSKTWLDGPKGLLAWKRAVVRTESDDFVHWSRPHLVMWPDEIDGVGSMKRLAPSNSNGLAAERGESARGLQLHGGPAFYYNGAYFSLLQVLDLDATGLMPTELAISRDGLEWKRPFREDYFLPVEGGNRFDSGTIWTNATPIYHEDEIWFYYGSYIAWHLNHPDYDDKRFSGIGLAIMPRDRFAGLKPIDRFDQVTLKPVNLSGCKGILLNADASSGSIQVELIDEDGYRVKGFHLDQAQEITGDGLRHKVHWKHNELSDLTEGKYLLRIHLDNSTLYAVTYLR